MSVPYNYSVYREKKGQIFVDNILTRATYYVLDPNTTSSRTLCYAHKDTTSVPLLFANINSVAPVSSSSDASYNISLYRGSSHSLISSVQISPSETQVSNNLVIPNDVYLGPSRDWKISVDVAKQAILFERKDSSLGTYTKEFEICNTK